MTHTLSADGLRHIEMFKKSFTPLLETDLAAAKQLLKQLHKSIIDRQFSDTDLYFIRNVYWGAVDLLKNVS